MNWSALMNLLSTKEKLLGHPNLSWLMPVIDKEIAALVASVEKEVKPIVQEVAPPVTSSPTPLGKVHGSLEAEPPTPRAIPTPAPPAPPAPAAIPKGGVNG